MNLDAINQGLDKAVQTERIQHLTAADGPWAVLHPEPEAVIVTVGEVKNASGVEQLLLRRWQEPARYGMWLPLLMRDGQLAVACHRPRRRGEVEHLSEADWASLMELLQ